MRLFYALDWTAANIAQEKGVLRMKKLLTVGLLTLCAFVGICKAETIYCEDGEYEFHGNVVDKTIYIVGDVRLRVYGDMENVIIIGDYIAVDCRDNFSGIIEGAVVEFWGNGSFFGGIHSWGYVRVGCYDDFVGMIDCDFYCMVMVDCFSFYGPKPKAEDCDIRTIGGGLRICARRG